MPSMSIPIRGALALLGVVAVMACGDAPGDKSGKDALPEDQEEEGGTPVSGGTAVIAELADMEKPMPLVWQSQLDSDLVDMMYMGLTRMVWRDGRPAYLLSDESPMAIAYRWQYAN